VVATQAGVRKRRWRRRGRVINRTSGHESEVSNELSPKTNSKRRRRGRDRGKTENRDQKEWTEDGPPRLISEFHYEGTETGTGTVEVAPGITVVRASMSIYTTMP
jgi:hypothetical protein